jgi:hypothetical protein
LGLLWLECSWADPKFDDQGLYSPRLCLQPEISKQSNVLG